MPMKRCKPAAGRFPTPRVPRANIFNKPGRNPLLNIGAGLWDTYNMATGLLGDVLSHYKDELRPAIILIPGREGSLGIGRDNIQRAIERAVGADIL